MRRWREGVGKSRLSRVVAGLARPLSGSMKWDGENINGDPDAHNANLHYVVHADPVKPVLTVGENLRFWALMKNGGGKDEVTAALDQLGIGHLESVPGRFLSAGQKQIGRAHV